MSKELQTERVGIRFTPSEAKMLTELSEKSGMSMTNVIRRAIRTEHEALKKRKTKK